MALLAGLHILSRRILILWREPKETGRGERERQAWLHILALQQLTAEVSTLSLILGSISETKWHVPSSTAQVQTVTEKIFPTGLPSEVLRQKMSHWLQAALSGLLGAVQKRQKWRASDPLELKECTSMSIHLSYKCKVWCTHWALRPRNILPKEGGVGGSSMPGHSGQLDFYFGLFSSMLG